MCGICGVLSRSPESPLPDPAELVRIDAALARRGPDGTGSWRSTDGRLLLGHRRLAILDLSPAGAQPMTTFDGRFTIVFNGEIYNFRELAAGLERDGARFASRSDTEVILELYRRHGIATFALLRGMFALAIWDDAAGELLLARDPYGIKPLYYSLEGGLLRFASQVRALEAGGALPLDIDPAAVAGLLSWGSVPEPLTLRRAIRAVPAGHWARATRDGRFLLEAIPRISHGVSPADAGSAISDSVSAHLVSDVEVGLFLSAGLDSALVAALAARSSAAKPVALTLTWAEARGTVADEEPLARATASRLGLRHVVREISGDEVRERLPEIVAAMDQPSIDGFNTWLVARAAREEGLKVALSGLGGDELFGGYSSFRDVPAWSRRARRLRCLPGLQSVWPALARRFARETPKLAHVLRYADSIAGAYALRRAVFLPHEVDALLERAGLATAGARPYDAPYDAWRRLGESVLGDPSHLLADPWQAVHRLESQVYLRNQLLRDADWAGMAHGVEIRAPLVDARLRGALAAARFEPARTGGKAALVRALAPELPDALWARPKSGFQLPVADWLEAKDGRRNPSPVSTQSRRLATLVLGAFGVQLPA